MIPYLVPHPQTDNALASYLEELERAGFQGDICDDAGTQAVFSTDNSIYEIRPQCVLFPQTPADVSLAIRLMAKPDFERLSLTPRGGGTGTNGQSLNDSVVLDLSRHLSKIVEINVKEGWVRVQAGVVKDQLNAALLPKGMFFAPELSTSNRATVGGTVNTDASGQGSCLYGKTRDHVLELSSVLSDGSEWRSGPIVDADLALIKASDGSVARIHRELDKLQQRNSESISRQFPPLNRCLTGYDLAHLRSREGLFDLNSVLCGSEGTLAVIVEAKLSILPIPEFSALVNIQYGSFDAALRDARSIMTFSPASIETIDSTILDLAREDTVWESVREFFPSSAAGKAMGVNLVEFVGMEETEVRGIVDNFTAALLSEALNADCLGFTVAHGENAVHKIWQMRKRAVSLLGNTPGDKRPIPFVEDTVVPLENLADYIAEFRALLDSHGLDYGMFGHVDAGVLHVRPAIDLKDPDQENLIRSITDSVAELALKYGGLLWGEHGKGVRSEYGPTFFGDLYPSIKDVKPAFDPANRFNPGKIASLGDESLLAIDAVPMRGQLDRRIEPATRERFSDVLHCNGNAVCYDWNPDTAMCPSWKSTRERRHSPKGRATLTKEWLRRLAANGTSAKSEAARLHEQNALVRLSSNLIDALPTRRVKGDFSHIVKEAMDGCLACKSCVGGCPVKVNVPNFRSQFLDLYHGRYPRPIKDYVVSNLEAMLPLARRAPTLVNLLLGGKFGAPLMRALGLVDLPRISPLHLTRKLDAYTLPVMFQEALSMLPPERAHAQRSLSRTRSPASSTPSWSWMYWNSYPGSVSGHGCQPIVQMVSPSTFTDF